MEKIKEFGLAGIVSAYLIAANTCAFVSVAADKSIGRTASEAAIHSILNDTPFVNSIGYSLAHERFYGNADYRSVALDKLNE